MIFPHDTCAFPRRVKLCTWEIRLLKALCQRLKSNNSSYETHTLIRLAKAVYNQPFARPQELEEPSKVYADFWRPGSSFCDEGRPFWGWERVLLYSNLCQVTHLGRPW